ncbi:MAG: T9SS type A sorting domain-containing protein [Flavobacterium sp.]|nr:T9SS type A sorting domain-containing protein [Flavobacterium sp.]
MWKYLYLFLLTSICINAQTPVWSSAKFSGGIPYQSSTQTVTDSQGNLYTFGVFDGSISFDNLSPITASYFSNGTKFFAKFDSLGNCLWLKKIEGTNAFSINSAIIDNNNNIIIGCSSSSNLTNSISLDDTNPIIQIDGNNFFIAKFDTNGTFLWSKKQDLGINYGSFLGSLTLGENDTFFASGAYGSSGMEIDGINLPINSFGNSNMFIVHFNSDGTIIWIKGFGDDTMSYDAPNIYFYGGNLFLTSFTDTDISFESVNIIVPQSPYYFQFILKMSSTGTPISGHEINLPFSDLSYINKKFYGNYMYIYGSFDESQLNINGTILNRIGNRDIFIIKYNLNGSFVWAKNFGYSNHPMLIQDIFVDTSDNIYLAADTSTPNLVFGTSTINNFGQYSTIIGKLNSAGNQIWAKNITNNLSNQYNFPQTITKANNLIHVFGKFNYEQLNFDNISVVFNPSPVTSLAESKIYYGSINESALNTEDFIVNSLIYPNPTKDYLNLNSDYNNKTYEIIDISGRIIQHGSIISSFKINVSDLNKGLYLLNIANEISFKFLKD